MRDARIAGGRVRKRDDRAGVELAVRGEELRPKRELGAREAVADVREDDADELGEVAAAELVEERHVEVTAALHAS